MAADALAGVLRALGFVGLFQATGAVFFVAVFGQRSEAVIARIRRLVLVSAAVAIGCLIAQQTLEAARFAGELRGIFQSDLVVLAWSSSSGMGQAARLAGLSVILIGISRATDRGLVAASVGAVIALLSFLASGHTSVHPLRALLAPLLALHLFVVAFWFGSLVPLNLLSRDERIEDVFAVLQRFSAIAAWLVPLILAAGLAMAFVLAPGLSVFQRPYGQLLLLKLAGFALLMLLAAYNRWRLVPAIGAGAVTAFVPLRRSIATELLLIVALLAITAALTLFFSPES